MNTNDTSGGSELLITEKIIEILNCEQFFEEQEDNSKLIDIELEKLGVSSIAYIKLLVLLETEFEIEFQDEHLQLYHFKTVKEIIEYIIIEINSESV